MRTIFPLENDGFIDSRTVSAQILAESGKKMRFPKIIEHRGFKVKIYGKTAENPCYRLNYRSAGKRHQPNFQTFSEALKQAKTVGGKPGGGVSNHEPQATVSSDGSAILSGLAKASPSN